MTIRIKARKSRGMELNGNILSGDTYPMRDYIKAYMDGRWNPTTKTWTVDRAKVEQLLATPGALIAEDKSDARIEIKDGFKIRKGFDGWCDKCHSYCYGDCDA